MNLSRLNVFACATTEGLWLGLGVYCVAPDAKCETARWSFCQHIRRLTEPRTGRKIWGPTVKLTSLQKEIDCGYLGETTRVHGLQILIAVIVHAAEQFVSFIETSFPFSYVVSFAYTSTDVVEDMYIHSCSLPWQSEMLNSFVLGPQPPFLLS